MVKSVLGSNYQGLRDFLIQRMTALIMVVYSVGLFGFFLFHPDLHYYTWYQLFTATWVKVFTLLFIGCVLFHTWVGVWTIFTDYVKIFVLRFILSSLVFLSLIALFIEALVILWGI